MNDPHPHRQQFLAETLEQHLRLHFTDRACAAVAKLPLEWGPPSRAPELAPGAVLFPLESSDPAALGTAWKVPFGSTQLTLWGRLPCPQGWRPWPDAEHPLWYFGPNGSVMIAATTPGNCFDLLTLAEEREAPRDQHGRCLGATSPRDGQGLLEVPLLNEWAAALVDLAIMRSEGLERPRGSVEGWAQPVAVVLSHDLDLLSGNDLWTQGARVARIARTLVRERRFDRLAGNAIVENFRNPEKYYAHAIHDILAVEDAYGARSTYYFLNGTGGRYGARSGDRSIPAVRQMLRPTDGVGIHYNVDTHLDAARFRAQHSTLQRTLGDEVLGGRAHYLRWDPAHSFEFLESMNLQWDESLGFPDRIGYRAGIAGPYRPLGANGARLALVEVPLTVMDSTLVSQYGASARAAWRDLLHHLQNVGGAISYLMHPGTWNNPENCATVLAYPSILDECSAIGARYVLAEEFDLEP